MKEDFIKNVLPYAERANVLTGIPVSVILAQWALETGWGESRLFKECFSLAGIKYHGEYKKSGAFTCYDNFEQALNDWVRTINLSYYDAVRKIAKAGGIASSVAEELGKSPWAEGHYNNGQGPGSSLKALMVTSNLFMYDAPRAIVYAYLENELAKLSVAELIIVFGKVLAKKVGGRWVS